MIDEQSQRVDTTNALDRSAIEAGPSQNELNKLSPHQPTTCLFKINRENNVQKSYVVPGQQKYPL